MGTTRDCVQERGHASRGHPGRVPTQAPAGCASAAEGREITRLGAKPLAKQQVLRAALESPEPAGKPNDALVQASVRGCVRVSLSWRWHLERARGQRFTGCSVYEHSPARSVCLIAQCTVTPAASCIIHLPQRQSRHLLKTVISWSELPFRNYLFMQLIFPQQITDRSASSIGKAANEPWLAAAAERVTLLERKILPLHIVPLCCHLPLAVLVWGCLSVTPTMELHQPSEPARSGGWCMFRGLSPLSLLILGITSAPAMTGEKTLMKGHSWPRNRWRRRLLQNISPLDFSNIVYEVQRTPSCPIHNEMKAVLQPPSKKTNRHIPGAISGSLFKHICQVLSKYAQKMFQNMLPLHSFRSLQELALLTEVKKAFLNSVCHNMLLSLLSDRANVGTFTA